MGTETADTSARIVKVPFPVALIRRMDQAVVAGRGGFRTRAELMCEAVENLLNELDFPEAPAQADRDALVVSSADGNLPRESSFLADLVAAVPAWERDELTVSDIAATALTPPPKVPELVHEGVAKAPDEPLLGLHNRDYVSIWAAQRLARYTADSPIAFDEYLSRVTAAAWYYGDQLRELEARDAGRKLSVLFPTNTAKQPSAERGFQSFAVGTLSRRPDRGDVVASGPLFAWGAIQVTPDPPHMVGLTEEGWDLMHGLEGLSLALPHPPALMSRFLSHLAEHAPGDGWGFEHLLRIVDAGPARGVLVASFADAHPEWRASTASSVAQGYVARGREWGLVEPKLVEGRYWLTDVGRARLAEIG